MIKNQYKNSAVPPTVGDPVAHVSPPSAGGAPHLEVTTVIAVGTNDLGNPVVVCDDTFVTWMPERELVLVKEEVEGRFSGI